MKGMYKYQGRSHPPNPPPDWWRPEITVEAERYLAWLSLESKERKYTRDNYASMQKNRERLRQKVEDGTANLWQRRLWERGFQNRHKTPEAAAKAQAMVQEDSHRRISEETLAYRLKYSSSCSVEGCPLSKPWLLCLVWHDHTPTKTATTAWRRASDREALLGETKCVCLWHHYMNMRGRRNFKPAVTELSLLKEVTGCQHPLHSKMPFASLVPSAEDDPLMYGFLQVSHRIRKCGPQHTPPVLLDQLKCGDAAVHCSFCHAIWSLCENYSLYSTAPLTAHEATVLAKDMPEFVANFKYHTAGVDWASMREATQNKKRESFKRKREK